MAWENKPAKTIVLVKMLGTAADNGATFRWTFKSLPPQEALVRARKALLRAKPKENLLHWKLVRDE